jgi:hypothetical protein
MPKTDSSYTNPEHGIGPCPDLSSFVGLSVESAFEGLDIMAHNPGIFSLGSQIWSCSLFIYFYVISRITSHVSQPLVPKDILVFVAETTTT